MTFPVLFKVAAFISLFIFYLQAVDQEQTRFSLDPLISAV